VGNLSGWSFILTGEHSEQNISGGNNIEIGNI
jgi:hypothetical protein